MAADPPLRPSRRWTAAVIVASLLICVGVFVAHRLQTSRHAEAIALLLDLRDVSDSVRLLPAPPAPDPAAPALSTAMPAHVDAALHRLGAATGAWNRVEAVRRAVGNAPPGPELDRLEAAVLDFVNQSDAQAGRLFDATLLLSTLLLAGLCIGMLHSRRQQHASSIAHRDGIVQLRTTLASLTEGVLSFDAAGRVVDGNPAAERLLGKSLSAMRSDPRGCGAWAVCHEDGTPMAVDLKPVTRTLATGTAQLDRIIGVDVPGQEAMRLLRMNVEPLREAGGGRVVGAVASFLDVTDERRSATALAADRDRLEDRVAARTRDLESAFLALREVEHFAQTITDNQPALIAYWDRSERLRFVNRSWLEWFGLTRGQALGRTVASLFGDAGHDRRRASMQRLVQHDSQHDSQHGEIELDGVAGRHGRFWIQRVPDQRNGSIEGHFVIATDISELSHTRERLEALNEALVEAERFSRQVADSIPGRVTYWDRESRCRFVNRLYCEWLRMPASALLGRTARDIGGDARWASMQHRFARALAGEMQVFEREETGVDGQPAVSLLQYTPDVQDGEVRGFFVLATDITSTKAAEHQLRELNEQLSQALGRAESATRSKSAFVANMSHEIRTPMNAILGLTHLLSREVVEPAQRERVDKIDHAARHLLQIINDILDLSKIEAGKLGIEETEFAVDPMLAHAFDLVRERARDNGIELVLDTDHLPPRLRGDPTRLSQALVNLLTNAVKFTRSGWIRLRGERLAQDGDRLQLRFAVTDTGVGIAEDRIDRLFQPYEQADEQATRRHGGTGLGLALTRHLARLMGGEVGVTSRVGAGSTFWFTAWVGRAGPGTESATPPSLENLRALLVDDLAEARASVSDRLRSLGLEVEEAASGPEALDCLQRAIDVGRVHDVVLVDWRMEPLDGFATIHALRERIDGRSPPIVLVSAADDPTMRAQAREARCDAVLIKPVTASALHDALVHVLRNQAIVAAEPPQPGPEECRLRDEHAGQRVLLAEDNAINQEVAAELLRAVGLSVAIVDDGQSAVERARSEPFDLILMDVQMPRLDGLAAAREIRRDLGETVPIVAMTANAFSEDRLACLDAGMNDHVAKPVDPSALYATLLRWLPPARALRVEATPGQAASVPDTADPDEAMLERLSRLPGYDLDAALRLLDRRVPRLRRALVSFVRAYREGDPELTPLAGSGDTARARSASHSLRGACATVGAVGMVERLLAYEERLHGATPPDELVAEGQALQEALRRLAVELDEALAAEPASAAVERQ